MSAGLVSIVIPAFRPGPIFRDTLRSCLAQDWPELEVVVCEDGEDPAVRSAIEEAADPRVRWLRNEARLGQFGNFNRAVDESRGELIKLFSADDLMAPDCVRRMAEALQAHPALALCASREVTFFSGPDGAILERLELPESEAAPHLALAPEAARRHLAWYGNQLGGPSNVMLRRSAWWASGGFDPRITHLGDLAYWCRVAARGGLLLVDRPLVAYRIHANSVTGRDALRMVRIDEPFAMADDATLGAWFPGRRWWRRLFLQLWAVNATTGYALSMLRREPAQGALALARTLGSAGLLALPLTALAAAWSVVRGTLLRRGTLWPARPPRRVRVVRRPGLDAAGLCALLGDPAALHSLLEGPEA